MVISDGKIQAMEDLIDCLQHIVCRKYHARFVELMDGILEPALALTADPEEKKDIAKLVVEKLTIEIRECTDSVVAEYKVFESIKGAEGYEGMAEVKQLLTAEIVHRILKNLTASVLECCGRG